VIMLAALLAYGGCQAYLCFQSYEAPAWSYNVNLPASIRYPAVLICPLGYKVPHDLVTSSATCTYGFYTDSMDYNETACAVKTIHIVQNARGNKVVDCILANYLPDDSASTFAYSFLHTYLEVSLMVNRTIKSQKNQPLYPVQVSLFSQAITDYASLSHDFVAMPGNAFWGVLQKSQDLYMDGKTSDSYQVSVSSTRISEDNSALSATFSFASFDVSQSMEYVYFDWLSLLGVLGGASSLGMALHLLLMLAYEKLALRLYRRIFKKQGYQLLGQKDGNVNDDGKDASHLNKL